VIVIRCSFKSQDVKVDPDTSFLHVKFQLRFVQNAFLHCEDVLAHLEVGNELGGLLAQAAMVGDIPPRLHQQQVIKRLKDVNAGLVDGAHHSAPSVHSVTHTPHDNGCCSGIQACSCVISFGTA